MTSSADRRIFSKENSTPRLYESLKSNLSDICKNLYSKERDTFVSKLSDYERRVYSELLKLPYDPKDFWRNLHDIIVTSHLKKLVSASAGAVPEWLVVAALIHDRGYALLAELGKRNDTTLQGSSYFALTGPHWDGVDTRIKHSLLSAKTARYIFEGSSDDAQVDSVLQQYGVSSIPLPESLARYQSDILTVITEHDYPRIGRYKEISPSTRHHYDADSLYSISVTSFIKDYLFYVGDARRMEKWSNGLQQGGKSEESSFELTELFILRLNRYFEEGDAISTMLTPFLRRKGGFGEALFEAQETIRPHSVEAKKRTEEAFLRLLHFTDKMKVVSSERDFVNLVELAALEELTLI